MPDPFHRIEVGCLSGQLLEMDPSCRPTGQEVLARLTTMDRGALPDEEELAGHLAEQEVEQSDHIRAVGGRTWRLHHQAVVGREGGDGRAMIAGQGHLPDWSLPVSCPGADVMGQQRAPRRVPPHDHPGFLVGLFF